MPVRFVVLDKVGTKRFYAVMEGCEPVVGARWTDRLGEASHFGAPDDARAMIKKRRLDDIGLTVHAISTRTPKRPPAE